MIRTSTGFRPAEVTRACSLNQRVTFRARDSGILDLIFRNKSDLYDTPIQLSKIGNSDHYTVLIAPKRHLGGKLITPEDLKCIEEIFGKVTAKLLVLGWSSPGPLSSYNLFRSCSHARILHHAKKFAFRVAKIMVGTMDSRGKHCMNLPENVPNSQSFGAPYRSRLVKIWQPIIDTTYVAGLNDGSQTVTPHDML
jgi:hypothetical protein